MKTLLTLLFIPVFCSAQHKVALEIIERSKGHSPVEHHLFKKLQPSQSAALKTFTPLELDTNEFKKIKKDKNGYIKLDSLLLYPVENNTEIIFSDGVKRDLPEVVSYRGVVQDDASSLVSITFGDDEVIGLISTKYGNHIIAKGNNGHIIYNDKDLTGKPEFECTVSGDAGITGIPTPIPMQTTKCVQWYWEIDYDIYASKGAGTPLFMQGIFNQDATLYANDGMQISLKTLFIWTTQDPYTSTTTGGNLSQFGAYRTTFNGDLAHLIGIKGNGGIAYINGICSTNMLNRKGYSGISLTYSNVPVYSWTVENIAHEEGHLLGSNHTHDCAWNGNFTKIDSCGDKAGYPGTGFYGCPVPPAPISLPASGGTIMSYCHLTSAGINFSLGFGQQPRDRMIDRINNGICLISCTTPPPPVTIKIDSIKTSTTNKAQLICYWQQVSGAVSYKFYWQKTGNTGNNVLGSTAVSPKTFSLSSNQYYNIWFEARNSSGTIIGTSPKVSIQTGTGITYK